MQTPRGRFRDLDLSRTLRCPSRWRWAKHRSCGSADAWRTLFEEIHEVATVVAGELVAASNPHATSGDGLSECVAERGNFKATRPALSSYA
jgi:hypothetical protein